METEVNVFHVCNRRTKCKSREVITGRRIVRLVIQALCAINGDWEVERRIESSRTSQKECGIEDGASAV